MEPGRVRSFSLQRQNCWLRESMAQAWGERARRLLAALQRPEVDAVIVGVNRLNEPSRSNWPPLHPPMSTAISTRSADRPGRRRSELLACFVHRRARHPPCSVAMLHPDRCRSCHALPGTGRAAGGGRPADRLRRRQRDSSERCRPGEWGFRVRR